MQISKNVKTVLASPGVRGCGGKAETDVNDVNDVNGKQH